MKYILSLLLLISSLSYGQHNRNNAVIPNSSLGTIPIANGGTNNASLSVTNGNLMYSDGTKIVGLTVGSASKHLVGGTIPTWVDSSINKSIGIQTLPADTWTGTPPSTLTGNTYTWGQSAKEVTFHFHISYTNAGTSNTAVTFDLPPRYAFTIRTNRNRGGR